MSIPDSGEASVLLLYENGFKGPGQPSKNQMEFFGGTIVKNPSLGSTTIRVAPLVVGGRQLPGDCNQDRTLDVSDAICLFGFLFLGAPVALPCGDGTVADPGNVRLADWQGDRAIDLSDGIGLLQFLFAGGAPHALASPEAPATGCVPMEGCPDLETCTP
jgi:hypothetical protein